MSATAQVQLSVRHEAQRLQIVHPDTQRPILVQHAPVNQRPYIHPILAPDGRGCLTENEPWHHLWQHGLYTGLHGVNDMDFWTEGLSGNGLASDGTFHPAPLAAPHVDDNQVQWQVATEWRSTSGTALLLETQHWTFQFFSNHIYLDIHWELSARVAITFAKCSYGGLFLRMPFRAEVGAEVIHSEGLVRPEADGARARWVAVFMPLPARDDAAGIALFDHPGNLVYPSPWRVDGQFGVSPSRCILGEWSLAAGESAHEKYRLAIFNGDHGSIEEHWQIFSNLSWEDL
jgi:hypothetical protein